MAAGILLLDRRLLKVDLSVYSHSYASNQQSTCVKCVKSASTPRQIVSLLKEGLFGPMSTLKQPNMILLLVCMSKLLSDRQSEEQSIILALVASPLEEELAI